MNDDIILALAKELNIGEQQVRNTLDMLAQGDTVPFIARYRKEQTKGLDEEQILAIQKQYDYEIRLAERKEDVLRLIEEQGKLTDEIRESVDSCTKLSQVEDIYRPYMQKKRPAPPPPSRPGSSRWPTGCSPCPRRATLRPRQRSISMNPSPIRPPRCRAHATSSPRSSATTPSSAGPSRTRS